MFAIKRTKNLFDNIINKRTTIFCNIISAILSSNVFCISQFNCIQQLNSTIAKNALKHLALFTNCLKYTKLVQF
jgi:hypothetical protein